MIDSNKHVEIIVKGRVQGVAFRYYTKLKADELGIKGTVQNLSDGSVKIFASCSPSKIERFLEWCKEGSPASKVNEVLISDSTKISDPDFSILR